MIARIKALATRIPSASRGVILMLGSSLIAYAITLSTLPIITRLYGPDSYGAYAFVTALVATVAPAAALRLESAAMLPKDKQDVIPLSAVAMLSTLVIATLYATGIHLWLALGDPPDTAQPFTALWVFLTVFLGSLVQIFSQLALRSKSYGAVASRSVFRSFGTAAAQLTASLVTRSGWGLNLGATIGSTVGIGALYRHARPFLGRASPRAMVSALRRYWRFPLVFTPAAFLNALGLQLPLLFVAATFGGTTTGHVGAAERVVSVPITLIGMAVGQVVTAEFAERIRSASGGYLQPFLRASSVLGVAALATGVASFLLAPWLIPTYLGSEWAEAGQYAQVIAATTSIRIITSPLSSLLVLFERSRANLILDVMRVFIVGGGAIVCSQLHFSALESLWILYGALGLTHAIMWVYLLTMIRKETDRADGKAAA